jgi:hypothetical protein
MITGMPYPLPDDSPLLAGDVRFHHLRVLQHLQAANKGVQDDESDSLRAFQAMIKAAPLRENLVAAVLKLVNKQVVKAPGLETEVEESKQLSSYGIGSLAAVNLRNWLKKHLGAELTTLVVLNTASLQALCIKVVEQLVKVKG